VPRDLSVVGYNNIPEAERSDPPLTTVDELGVQKGRTAARICFQGRTTAPRNIETTTDYAGLNRTSTSALKEICCCQRPTNPTMCWSTQNKRTSPETRQHEPTTC
jgi:hypothetical protein